MVYSTASGWIAGLVLGVGYSVLDRVTRRNRQWPRYLRAWCLVLPLLISGCVSYQSSDFVQNIDQRYQAGQYLAAAEAVEQQLGFMDVKTRELQPVVARSGEVLLHLEAAENWRLAGNPRRAIAHYDALENLFKDKDVQGSARKLGENVGAALVNDAVRSYEPPPAERILTNFYKALAFWSLGEKDNARVEFNRANERARMAVERYQDMINEAERENRERSGDAYRNLQSSGVKNALRQNFPNMDQWQVYDSFVNPAVAYMNAMFLAAGSGSDIGQAETLLTRVNGMVGGHPIIAQDLLNIRERGRLRGGVPQRWIVFESGLSPVYGEKRFSIPWFTMNAFIQVTVALPELVNRTSRGTVNGVALANQTVEFLPLARMDRIMQTEFQKRWAATVSRAVVSAASKAILQDRMAKEFGPLGNFAGMIYANASASADTRGWHAMPEQWSLAKMPATQAAELRIPYGSGMATTMSLPANKDVLIYIKQPSPNAAPYVELFYL